MGLEHMERDQSHATATTSTTTTKSRTNNNTHDPVVNIDNVNNDQDDDQDDFFDDNEHEPLSRRRHMDHTSYKYPSNTSTLPFTVDDTTTTKVLSTTTSSESTTTSLSSSSSSFCDFLLIHFLLSVVILPFLAIFTMYRVHCWIAHSSSTISISTSTTTTTSSSSSSLHINKNDNESTLHLSLGGFAPLQALWKFGLIVDSKVLFNWHPFFMILSFVCMTMAILSFSWYTHFWNIGDNNHNNNNNNNNNRIYFQYIHILGWTFAAFFMILGMWSVWRSHYDPISGYYIANVYYSLHSWVGVLAMILYVLQYLFGFVAFFIMAKKRNRRINNNNNNNDYEEEEESNHSCRGDSHSCCWKRRISCCFCRQWRLLLLQIHPRMGSLIYGLVVMTILLGLQEKEGLLFGGGCSSYSVDFTEGLPSTTGQQQQQQQQQQFSWKNNFHRFQEIPSICRVSHGIGLLVLATAFGAAIVIQWKIPSMSMTLPQQQRRRRRQQQQQQQQQQDLLQGQPLLSPPPPQQQQAVELELAPLTSVASNETL